MSRLLVKVDHIATLREGRRATEPDPIIAAAVAEMAGADGVVVHLRGDRRHIKSRDLELLRQTIKTRLVLQIAPTQEMTSIAHQVKPDQVMLVQERPDEVTTETGLDVIRDRESLAKHLAALKDGDIPVGLVIEPDIDQVKAAHKLDVDAVQFNMSRYCDAKFAMDRFHAFNGIVNAAKAASKLNLTVLVGQGLTYHNIQDLQAIQEIDEYVVGFAIIARAVIVGMDRAVREMVELLK